MGTENKEEQKAISLKFADFFSNLGNLVTSFFIPLVNNLRLVWLSFWWGKISEERNLKGIH